MSFAAREILVRAGHVIEIAVGLRPWNCEYVSCHLIFQGVLSTENYDNNGKCHTYYPEST
jgi:hypothetical protein